MSRAIYVVRSEPEPTKVGISSNPSARLYQLCAASTVPLSMDFAAEVGGDPRALERRAHAILSDRRVPGRRENAEWFQVGAQEAVAAVLQAAEELGVALQPLTTPIQASLRRLPGTQITMRISPGAGPLRFCLPRKRLAFPNDSARV